MADWMRAGIGWLGMAGLLGLTGGGGAGCASTEVRAGDFSMQPVELQVAGEGERSPRALLTRRHLSNFKLCAQRGYQADRPQLRGEHMEVHFRLTSTGEARQVQIATPAFQGSTFAQCVERILHWVPFPSQAGEASTIRMWLVLDDERPFLGELHAERE